MKFIVKTFDELNSDNKLRSTITHDLLIFWNCFENYTKDLDEKSTFIQYSPGYTEIEIEVQKKSAEEIKNIIKKMNLRIYISQRE